jgi:uncharacterized hydrophobic protein (TIGR00271 family)
VVRRLVAQAAVGDPQGLHLPAVSRGHAIGSYEPTADALSEQDEGEFQDLDAGSDPRPIVDRPRLRGVAVAQAAVALAVGLAVMLWPDRTDDVLARLIGLGLIGLALATLAGDARLRRWPSRRNTIQTAAMLGFGVWLAARPADSITTIARLVGAFLLLAGVVELIGLWRAPREDRGWLVTKAAALLAVGAFVLVFPNELLVFVTVSFAVVIVTLSAIALTQTLRADVAGDVSLGDAAGVFRAWIEGRPKDADDRTALYQKVLIEGADAPRRLVRFVTLMSLSSVIAATGILTDSTAVVIGAMLIAPLMTPLMATSMSLVMGWPVRLARSATTAAAGIAIAIGVGALLAVTLPASIDIATNSQIVSRSLPTVLDLVIAVAAGAAGAYALSRPDVSDALPGVAVAISLVPPLSVVGITWSQGAWEESFGALLLFSTNMCAILVVGGVTFVLTGVTPVRRVAENQRRIRVAFAGLAALATIVVGGLLLNGLDIARNSLAQDEARQAVTDWLGEDSDFDVIEVVVDGKDVRVVLIGPGSPPDVASLASRMAEALEKPVTVDVRAVLQERRIESSE